MNQDILDGAKLKLMLLSAAQFMEDNKESVNSLNVFPVPDGDTGTNMSLTMLSAAREIQAVSSGDLSRVADALSRGSLKGARGNSGVILSQLFRGFAKSLQGKEEITTAEYADALGAGVNMAYKAVMKPVEGTILTVARETAREAKKIARQIHDFNVFFDRIIDTARETLDRTPDMLPTLKQAGVVDSGGMGLVYILVGQFHALEGDSDPEVSYGPSDSKVPTDLGKPVSSAAEDRVTGPAGVPEGSIQYTYCTEFFIKNLYPYIREEDIEKLKRRLDRLGDSIVVVGDRDMIKVHFHTNMPGSGLQLGLQFGELSGIKIDNMKEQHHHVIDMETSAEPPTNEKEPEKDTGMVSVSMGKGIEDIFRDLNADYIIQGGQTMNPSTEDILDAVNQVNAKEIFILPNNGNIVLTANQAAEISKKKIHVVPSRTIPQGMAAMIAYNSEADAETNLAAMTRAMSQVKTGLVTYAVRDSHVDDLAIQQGDIMGMMEGRISVVGKDIADVTRKLLDALLKGNGEIVTILYGSNARAEDTESIGSYLSENYPDLEVEVLSGGQPLYYYIVSVE